MRDRTRKSLRDGESIHYSIKYPEEALAIFDQVVEWLQSNPELKRDREAFAKVCCASRVPIYSQRAQQPAALDSR